MFCNISEIWAGLTKFGLVLFLERISMLESACLRARLRRLEGTGHGGFGFVEAGAGEG